MLLAAGLAAWVWLQGARQERQGPLGLFTTLPIYWREAADLSQMLDSAGEQRHWARSLIERRRELRPLDVLAPQTLAPYRDLLVAQPRALAPAENVALDDWVRSGGRVLLLADPLLTEESSFALGDRRRPMDVALLSPILNHWGLELRFDEGQPAGVRMIEVMGASMPVDQSGRFTTQGQANCRLWGDGVAVTCAIGKGRVVAFADAALLDRTDAGGRGQRALQFLLDTAFSVR